MLYSKIMHSFISDYNLNPWAGTFREILQKFFREMFGENKNLREKLT
jgi:hypothetical protein